MLRTPLLCAAFLIAAWLEFIVYPGHSYLAGDTQLYVPMIERVDAPGLLTRDLVATNPNLALTAYDEITVFLHQSLHLSFRVALLAQLFLFRVTSLVGVFLLARTTALNRRFSLLLSVIVNLGVTLIGPAAAFPDREPVPGTFAISLVLLAMGLLGQEKPLVAALCGGVALLYDPIIAFVFWMLVLAGACFEPRMRPFLRPMAPLLIIFGLLLANLAQLQPSAGGEPALTHIPPALAAFQHRYAPYLRVSDWSGLGALQIALLCGFAAWAATRVWDLLNEYFRWLVVGAAVCGLLSVAASFLLVDQAQLAWVARLRPARTLLFTAVCAAMLYALAGMRAVLNERRLEAAAWLGLLFALPVGSVLLTPSQSMPPSKEMQELATWAETSTWGGAVFDFPNPGRSLEPGVFRAESRHGVWADWKSAEAVACSPNAAATWLERWRQPSHLDELLPEQIDYYVLPRAEGILNVRQVFSNTRYIVYDAQDLRDAPKPLVAARRAN